MRGSVFIQADNSLGAVEPTRTTSVTLVIINNGIKSAPATGLSSRTNGGFGVRRLWHILPALWLGIYLVYQTDTRPLRAYKSPHSYWQLSVMILLIGELRESVALSE